MLEDTTDGKSIDESSCSALTLADCRSHRATRAAAQPNSSPWRARPGLRRASWASRKRLVSSPPPKPVSECVGADHPVAGDDDRQRVGAVGGADRARRRGLADAARELAIGDRGAERDLAQRCPDAQLEGGAGRAERQRERPAGAGEVLARAARSPRRGRASSRCQPGAGRCMRLPLGKLIRVRPAASPASSSRPTGLSYQA